MIKKFVVIVFCFCLFFSFNVYIPIVYAGSGFEDLTAYTEFDVNNVWEQTVTRNTATNLRRDDVSYLYDDKGVDYFGDFEHLIDFQIIDEEDNCVLGIWLVSNEYGSAEDIVDGFLLWYHEASGNPYEDPRLFLSKKVDGVWTHDLYEMVSYNTHLYLTIERSGTTLTCKIYSDSDRTDLLDTLTLMGVVTTTWRYIEAGYSWETANGLGEKLVSGYVQNLDLQVVVEYTVTFYYGYGGVFRVNGTTVTNGSSNVYNSSDVLELSGLPHNSSFVFKCFNWSSSFNGSNPYNLTVLSNLTVWCMFKPYRVTIGLLFSTVFIVVACIVALGLLVGVKKRFF